MIGHETEEMGGVAAICILAIAGVSRSVGLDEGLCTAASLRSSRAISSISASILTISAVAVFAQIDSTGVTGFFISIGGGASANSSAFSSVYTARVSHATERVVLFGLIRVVSVLDWNI
jgi:hypothetical protein